MNFVYRNEFEKMNPSCPPESSKNVELKCYRWVFDSMDNENNFKSQAEKMPGRLNHESDKRKCDLYALSFHHTLEQSREHFNYFLSTIGESIYKSLGTNIAEGLLESKDGVAGNIDNKGHFNFHHTEEARLDMKFSIKESLG